MNDSLEKKLTSAISLNQYDVVKKLILNGACVNGDNSKFTVACNSGALVYIFPPLFLACTNCNIKIIKLLIDHNADVNKKNPHDDSPLLFFVINDNKSDTFEIVKLLVSHGANINEKTKNGTTPLMMAAYRNNLDIVKFLLFEGADRYLTDPKGRTFLDYATDRKSVEEIMFTNIKPATKSQNEINYII